MSQYSLATFSEDVANAVERAASSVVQIQGRKRPASGVVFSEHVVVTTTRALGRDEGLKVRTPDGRVLEAELGGWDPATSLVVLHVNDLNTAAAVPRRDTVRVGHFALAIGRSWSNSLTATSGIVAVMGGPLPTGPRRAIDRVIRTTAPMHSGFAGGALADVNGDLMGVATAAEIRGLQVVIPSDIVWKTAAVLAEHGTLKRGYLGIAGQSVRLPQQHREGERTNALLVVDVVTGSPAEAGGMLVGDVVVDFDNHAVESAVDLLELLQGDRVGRAISIRILRGGAPQELSVTVADRTARRA